VPIDVPTDEQALKQASQRVEEVHATGGRAPARGRRRGLPSAPRAIPRPSRDSRPTRAAAHARTDRNLTIEPGRRAARRRRRRTLRVPPSLDQPPPLSTTASPAHLTVIDVVALSCQNLLVILLSLATMSDVSGVEINASSAVAAPEPTHGEWAHTIQSSRSICPDIPDEKAANIMYA